MAGRGFTGFMFRMRVLVVWGLGCQLFKVRPTTDLQILGIGARA